MKVGGRRIELGEIEAALQVLPVGRRRGGHDAPDLGRCRRARRLPRGGPGVRRQGGAGAARRAPPRAAHPDPRRPRRAAGPHLREGRQGRAAMAAPTGRGRRRRNHRRGHRLARRALAGGARGAGRRRGRRLLRPRRRIARRRPARHTHPDHGAGVHRRRHLPPSAARRDGAGRARHRHADGRRRLQHGGPHPAHDAVGADHRRHPAVHPHRGAVAALRAHREHDPPRGQRVRVPAGRRLVVARHRPRRPRDAVRPDGRSRRCSRGHCSPA